MTTRERIIADMGESHPDVVAYLAARKLVEDCRQVLSSAEIASQTCRDRLHRTWSDMDDRGLFNGQASTEDTGETPAAEQTPMEKAVERARYLHQDMGRDQRRQGWAVNLLAVAHDFGVDVKELRTALGVGPNYASYVAGEE